MFAQLSLPLIAALLLSSFIIAPALGQRTPRNLDETIGLGACITLTLIKSTIVLWVVAHYVLQPLGLLFLNNLIAVLVIATLAHLVEAGLHNRYPNFFPIEGNLLPQIIVGALILVLPLLNSRESGLVSCVARAVLFGIGAAALLAVFQSLRERNASAQIPQPLRGPAIDMICAGLLVAALSGFAGIF
jgi:H+/Na+-translocating ferredoxin:NAD+ oxidoreductase subunit A